MSHEKSLLEVRLIMTEFSKTQILRSFERMCWTRFADPIGDSVIREVMLPKGEGDPITPWGGTDFRNDIAYWARMCMSLFFE